MTFDLAGASKQLDGMVAYLAATRPNREARSAQARSAFDEVCANWQAVKEEVSRSRLGYKAALPLEDPAVFHAPTLLDPNYVVAATDGSQIEPERHGPAEYFILNVGWAVIHYGEGAHAELGCASTVHFQEEDMTYDVEGRKVPIRDELLATARSLLERRKLADLLEALPRGTTTLGLADGTLLDWALEIRAQDLPPSVEESFREQFDRVRAGGHLMASYVSRPASRDVANLARVPRCSDRPGMDCRACTSKRATGKPACEAIDGLVDLTLFADLPPYHRSALFQPRQRVQKRYGEHEVCFFYLNAGPEIGRVEIPEWIANDAARLNLTHAIVADQCRRGRFHGSLPGYPPALVEAHEQAIIHAGDRALFEHMLERRLRLAGLPAELSAKRLSKQMKAV